MKEIRITHVVNCAEGRRSGQVNVNAWYYQDADIKYLGLPVDDLPSANIEDYFHCAAQFIDCALYNGGNSRIRVEKRNKVVGGEIATPRVRACARGSRLALGRGRDGFRHVGCL